MKISVDRDKLLEILGAVGCPMCPVADRCKGEAKGIPSASKFSGDTLICGNFILNKYLYDDTPSEWYKAVEVRNIECKNESKPTFADEYHPYPETKPPRPNERYKVILKDGKEVTTRFKVNNFVRPDVVSWKEE